MAQPTKTEVLAEIAKLTEMKPSVRHYDAFGGDNHRKVQIEIDTLTAFLDDDFEDSGEAGDDYEDSDERSCAEFAAEWAFGESEDGSPSENWTALVSQ